ncbi:MAG: exodeoxyribonuclease V subunit beta [Gammaproteobacteria bacterium]
MSPRLFDPATTELSKGINLIEASAGTGKTYAIVMLILRFVVEEGIPIEQLLAVTFTKAATEELKNRVRQRLAEAKRALSGPADNADGNVIRWLSDLKMNPEQIKERLDSSLLNIDRASIFTIHGFCQRLLKEHAMESGQLFDVELTGDIADIRQACADDFWRRQIYQRTPWEAAVLSAEYKTPDDLLAGIDDISSDIAVYPEFEDLDARLNELKQCAVSAKDELDPAVKCLKDSFVDGKFKPSYTEAFDRSAETLKNWLCESRAEPPPEECFNLLTGPGLTSALNGNKFRTNKIQTGEQRKSEYLAELAVTTGPFDKLDEAFKAVMLAFRRALLESLRQEIDKRLLKMNVLSFDELISRLTEALKGQNGELLTFELRRRFKAALIDEFQDTDANQWRIFSTLFAASSHYLYLIGDPKQAIYKFRGADIYAYLDAQEQAEYRYTLGFNWRSHPKLVQAVNALFKRERAFLLDQLNYRDVKPAKSAADGELCHQGKALAPMALWQLPEAETNNGYWTAGKAAEEIRADVVNEVVDLLDGDYRLGPKDDNLRPKDIAILVRTNTQAREYQAFLKAAGVPSVINSTASVFSTPEAEELYTLLMAIAHPGDIPLLRQALTLDWFGLDGQAFYRLIHDETAFDSRLIRFIGYHEDWQNRGLMAMMHHLLECEQVSPLLSKALFAERKLTNIHHLIELMQEAAVDGHLGVRKTLDWLKEAIPAASRSKNAQEDQQLRLESDDDAVQVITMHRAKGLEFPVVFCTYLWQRTSRLSGDKWVVKCHEQGKLVADLGTEQFESRRAQALTEDLAEDLRVAYVALTRAKYRCYLAWADVRTQNDENASALAWLFEFAGTGFPEQSAALMNLSESLPSVFDYRGLPVPGSIGQIYRTTSSVKSLRPKRRKRSLYTTWQMSSYTALSALSLNDAPEMPADKADEAPGREGEAPLQLPRGAHTGNVVHELLEKTAFGDLAEVKDIAPLRDRACQRYGLKLERPEVLDELLQSVVATPLSEDDPDFCLMHLDEEQCLKEMPFYLSMQQISAGHINAVLQGSPAFQPLSNKELCGFLTGFIDLVCEYKGRYYVMDYKTNDLSDYGPESLTDAMREHNYGLQYWLYTLVLHRYLRQRLPAYRYQDHFGGVRYLFVRGMQAGRPVSGVFQDSPDFSRLEALDQLFGR